MTRMWDVYTTFGEQHYFVSLYPFSFYDLSEDFFTLVSSVDICMIKSVNPEFQAEVNSAFHFIGIDLVTVPSIETIDSRRNFRTRITQIDLFHFQFLYSKIYLLNRPASSTNCEPVTTLDLSEERNTTALATSSGSTQGTLIRLPALFSPISFGVNPSNSASPSFMGVFTPVG